MNHKTRLKIPKAPSHLSAEGKREWGMIVDGWQLDDAALLILQSFCEAGDRERQARAALAKEGLTTKDRFGQAKVNPSVLVERDCKALRLRLIKGLGLDLEPIGELGRPGRKPNLVGPLGGA